MVIDLILDRKDGLPYSPHKFYTQVCEYNANFQNSNKILDAMDEGTEDDVQKALCHYIIDNDYRPAICQYIVEQKWLI